MMHLDRSGRRPLPEPRMIVQLVKDRSQTSHNLHSHHDSAQ
ncbi:hypothetical protein [Pseudomonas sp.]|nr:hypothetical protein [Pseudomonas sp.]MDP2245193.1 hypothetical protein [Pseudomonas sp.]